MQTVKDKQNTSHAALKGDFSFENVMESPRLVKVVVSVGTGSFKDKKKNDIVVDRLQKITGQKPSSRGAKKSIASFKLREAETIGFQVTLRGKRMYDFVDRLINIAFPRTKDFKGISAKAVDEMGNLTIGIKEHTIFPETVDEELKDVFGLAVTVVTTAKNAKVARAYLSHLGFPFKKEK